MRHWVAAILFGACAPVAWAGEVTLAVASNFVTTAEEIAAAFETETGHEIVLAHGSTGQIFSQVVSGAPFDVFLSADAERPAKLVETGRAKAARTYALGRLVLVSTVPVTRESALEAMTGKTVALADPTVAPYGKAAISAMEGLKLDTATFRPVLVSNVGQVASIFATGNAEFAFVSVSQLPLLFAPHALVLEGLYPDIRQDAALLDGPGDDEAVAAFWSWLFSPRAAEIIGPAGYGVPAE